MIIYNLATPVDQRQIRSLIEGSPFGYQLRAKHCGFDLVRCQGEGIETRA